MHLFPNNPYLRKVTEFCLVAVTCGIAIHWIDKQYAHQDLSDEEFENIILRKIQRSDCTRPSRFHNERSAWTPVPRFYNVGRPARLFRWLISQEYLWVDKHRRAYITRAGVQRLRQSTVIHVPPVHRRSETVDITNVAGF